MDKAINENIDFAVDHAKCIAKNIKGYITPDNWEKEVKSDIDTFHDFIKHKYKQNPVDVMEYRVYIITLLREFWDNGDVISAVVFGRVKEEQ